MNKFYKYLFSITLIMGTMVSISSLSWLTAWMGLEMNLLSMMPLMKSFKNKYSSEATIKYFITQASASLVLLLSILIITNSWQSSMTQNHSIYLTEMALLLKMGAAPLHFWLPEVVSGLTWPMTMVTLTWQKIAPMILFSYLEPNINLLASVIITSSLVGGILGMNQLCLRKLLAFSSINHIAWMLSTIMFSKSIWLIYFLTYSFINYSLILTLNKNKILFMNQMTKLSPSNKTSKLIFILNFLSLGGLPPFIGFLPKWLTIHVMTQMNMFFTSTILIVSTLIALFMYLRTMFSSMTLSSEESTKLYASKFNNMMIFTSCSTILGLALLMSMPMM
uniref:NADH-ubiquinone oxidoreductase chain 2 n=1 Tax=Scolytinae sp. BMNH 1040351 TaxID=1903793 RepID=A0A343A680_9CUCU|nr:NADH dehydrogenase subunit 2 [Scolytinae sp. BMNH 1040351]